MALTTRLVTATYLDAAERPLTGRVFILPNTTLSAADDDETIFSAPIVVTLDDTGSFSQLLICTDNPDISPPGWMYIIAEAVRGSTRPAWQTPIVSGDRPLDLATLTPYYPAPDTLQYLPITGGTLRGTLTGAVVELADTPTIAIDAAAGNRQRIFLGGNRALGVPAHPADGQMLLLEVVQDGTGGRTLSYPTVYEWGVGVPVPALTATPGARDFLGFTYTAATAKWCGIAFANGY